MLTAVDFTSFAEAIRRSCCANLRRRPVPTVRNGACRRRLGGVDGEEQRQGGVDLPVEHLLVRRRCDTEQKLLHDGSAAQVEELLRRRRRIWDGEAPGRDLAVEIGGEPLPALPRAGVVEGLARGAAASRPRRSPCGPKRCARVVPACAGSCDRAGAARRACRDPRRRGGTGPPRDSPARPGSAARTASPCSRSSCRACLSTRPPTLAISPMLAPSKPAARKTRRAPSRI